tara:strand:+ start:738 stop:857 length:120 start_codon:yes stop_codon:yes gene_type:complete
MPSQWAVGVVNFSLGVLEYLLDQSRIGIGGSRKRNFLST